MEKWVEQVVKEAEGRLRENPFDAGHDVHHHKAVWKNCQWIISQEGLRVDEDVLQVAAWWHDYDHGSKVHPTLRKVMRKYRVGKRDRNRVVELINEHSFADKQVSPEGQVLYDADKLEYVSVSRWERAMKKLNEKQMRKYKNLFNQRLDKVRKGFYFPVAQKMFDERFKDWQEWAKKEGLYKKGRVM
jgi:HD superfamily phosphodiesterase